jgi:hypothetical protein
MQGLMPKHFGKVKDCKVIFLNDKNLEILKGYKAEVIKELSVLPDSYPSHHGSVSIVITGLSNKAAKALEASLIALPEEEITDMMKKKGFNFTEAIK